MTDAIDRKMNARIAGSEVACIERHALTNDELELYSEPLTRMLVTSAGTQ